MASYVDPRVVPSQGPPPRWGQIPRLVSREQELAFLHGFVTRAVVDGGSQLVVGEPGVGKTVLLEAAAARAAAMGVRVLRASGVEFEAGVSFAGIHQVLLPLAEELRGFDPRHRKSIDVVLGLRDELAPDQLATATAIIALLSHAGGRRPVLVVVDDMQWLDRASSVLLGIVARRLSGTPVGLLGAVRTGENSLFESAGLTELEIGSLDHDAASTLLTEAFPGLAPIARSRVLAEAQGNPLALLELPTASIGHGPTLESIPPRAPVSRRLQSHFARRIGILPAGAQHQLLLAALDGGGAPGTAMRVSRDRLEDLGPAEHAQLVHVDPVTRRLQFRHPLTRAAVVELSSAEQRRRAHQQLAERLPPDDERRAWHLAEAATDPDEEIAALLEEAATRTQRRGDPVGAIALLLRSADLSPDLDDHHRRVMFATYLGMDVTGDLTDPHQLLGELRPGHSHSVATAVAAAAYSINSGGDVDATHRLLIGAVDGAQIPTDGWDQPMAEAVYVLNANCSFGSRADLIADYRAALARLKLKPPEILGLLGDTFLEPARFAGRSLARLDAAIEEIDDQTDHVQAVRLGIAAMYVDRLAGCRDALWRVIDHGRTGGAITSAIKAFALLGFDGLHTGDWDGVVSIAEEGLELAERHRYRLMGGFLGYDQAMVAAARGENARAQELTDELVRWASPARIGFVLQLAAHANALSALSSGDFDVAYHHARQVCTPGTVPAHAPAALWVLQDLVEAAVRAGRMDQASAHADDIRAAGIGEISPRLSLVSQGATALVASEDDYVQAFDQALAVPGASRWPFQLARLQLAYGERLRRSRANGRGRDHLHAALTTFRRLGATPWETRAANELRASGQRVDARGPRVLRTLTPQQREIALLAAEGLTNKQIGERLFLSPRTVSTHLYQLFPKLGITSRAALRDALTDPVSGD